MIWKSFNSYAACAQKLIFIISIHAPRERCELYRPIFTIVVNGFQSTHRVSDANLNGRHECFRSYDFNPRTAWAMRTQSLWDRHYQQKISIHAPRERCELADNPTPLRRPYFNPRTAWAMRTELLYNCIGNELFQSTHRVSDANLK